VGNKIVVGSATNVITPSRPDVTLTRWPLLNLAMVPPRLRWELVNFGPLSPALREQEEQK
jgi:hypothetical protein